MAMPEKSPLLFFSLACGSCGKIMEPKVVMGPRGVDHIEYECTNEKHDPYRIESTSMISAEMKPLRRDGTEVQL